MPHGHSANKVTGKKADGAKQRAESSNSWFTQADGRKRQKHPTIVAKMRWHPNKIRQSGIGKGLGARQRRSAKSTKEIVGVSAKYWPLYSSFKQTGIEQQWAN